jgi:hypothetical protein
LVAFVERSRYARWPGDAPNVRGDVDAVVSALRAGVSRGARLRAALLPASLKDIVSAGWQALRARTVGRGVPLAEPDYAAKAP